jgi:hypothetical protein
VNIEDYVLSKKVEKIASTLKPVLAETEVVKQVIEKSEVKIKKKQKKVQIMEAPKIVE